MRFSGDENGDWHSEMFNPTKGYGFIQPQGGGGGGKDVFVHISGRREGRTDLAQ